MRAQTFLKESLEIILAAKKTPTGILSATTACKKSVGNISDNFLCFHLAQQTGSCEQWSRKMCVRVYIQNDKHHHRFRT